MESFKIKDLLKRIEDFKSPKLYSLIEMCKYIWGDEYSSVDEKIYIKNLYNFIYGQCEIDGIEIYVVHENKFYVIFYQKNESSASQFCLKSYNLKDVESLELREHKAYGSICLDLNINFKNNCSYNLNSLSDTYEDRASTEYAELIKDIFNKLK